ncbi:hypothetical protein D3C80_1056820 [compost metagenome]
MRAGAAQQHLLAQAVGAERLMHFGNADFGGAAGIFEAGDCSRPGAAGIAGDVDDIGTRLGHTDGDRADTFRRDELDDDAHARRLAVMDQLRQILDRIGIVMRRRGDQLDARRAATGSGDLDRDLGGRQLAAFTGLCALADLDLQLFQHRIGKITGPDAETAGGELLDTRGADRAVARDMLAAFAGIRHASDHVGAVGNGFVSGRHQRAVAHGARCEKRRDFARRLNLIKRNAGGGGAEKLQVSESLAARVNGKRTAFQPMAEDICAEADDE